MISIIISAFNESHNEYLKKTISEYKNYPNTELIVVDGGSTDGTDSYLMREGVSFHVLTNSNRAERINYGVSKSSGSFLILYHPRNYIPIKSFEYIIKNKDKIRWAALSHKFDDSSIILSAVSWYSNYVRVFLKSIVYLDHCFILTKDLFNKAGKIPSIDIFEDTAFSENLKKHTRAQLLPVQTYTSSVRFRKNGILRQILMNQFLKLAYFLGLSHLAMNRFYEKKLELNQKYK